jgi:hypothetical protein
MTDERPVDETPVAEPTAAEPTAAEGAMSEPATSPQTDNAKSGDAPGAAGGQRIKIGSQRQAGARFKAEIKPPPRKFRPAPVPPGPMRDLAAKSGPKPASPATASPEAKSSPTPEQPAVEDQKPAGQSAERASENESQAAEAVPTLAKKVAITVADDFFTRERTPLPTDLQDEVDEMLTGVSLDEMISSTAAPLGAAEIEPDTRLRARVAKIHRDDVFIDLGGRNQGVVALHTFATAPEVGQVLEVIVRRFLPDEGLYEITAPGASVAVQDWSELSEGIVVDAFVTGHNKGGLECEVNRIRGFIPASQASTYRVADLSEFVGQKIACVVTEANEEKRNLVLSRRAVLEREQAEAKVKLMAEIAPGQIRDGVVRRITDFGAFVDIGGVDGLIHISQLSWDRVKHPSEVLHDGQKVKVRVDKIDPTTGKIGLSYRDTFDNPWTKADDKYPVCSAV